VFKRKLTVIVSRHASGLETSDCNSKPILQFQNFGTVWFFSANLDFFPEFFMYHCTMPKMVVRVPEYECRGAVQILAVGQQQCDFSRWSYCKY